MEWDQGKPDPRVHLWEGAVFVSLPTLIGLVALGDYLGVSRLILGFVFLFIPIAFVLCVMAYDQVRARGGFWR
jgi:hypothetical protein